jgi:hypothetical protein
MRAISVTNVGSLPESFSILNLIPASRIAAGPGRTLAQGGEKWRLSPRKHFNAMIRNREIDDEVKKRLTTDYQAATRTLQRR